MATRRTSKKDLTSTLRAYPFLWGVTGRWYPGRDYIGFEVLDIETLSKLTYSDVMVSRSGFSVYDFRKEGADVEVVHLGRTREGESRHGQPMAEVLAHYPDAKYLIRLTIRDDSRAVTIFDPGGKTIAMLCKEVLKK